MPGVIDPQTIHADNLPGIWVPIQWELSEAERKREIDDQATASLLWAVDVPEALIRLALSEYKAEPADEPPGNFDPTMQGDWDESLLTFKFVKPIELVHIERDRRQLYLEYRFANFGTWSVTFEQERVVIERI